MIFSLFPAFYYQNVSKASMGLGWSMLVFHALPLSLYLDILKFFGLISQALSLSKSKDLVEPIEFLKQKRAFHSQT